MSERTDPGVRLFGGYFNKDPSENTGVGRINRETFDWAMDMIQLKYEYLTSLDDPTTFDRDHTLAMIEHARWMIDRVRDGTLEVEAPPVERSNPDE